MLQGKTIGFFGAGSITEALIRGMLEGNVVQPSQIIVTNKANEARLDALSRRFGVRVATAKSQVLAAADVLVVACKPTDVAELLLEIRSGLRQGQVLLSVAAGVSTTTLAASLMEGVAVIRAMPNTSCQVGESATAFCKGPGASAESSELCRVILGAVGRVVEVSEHMLDAVTGLSGSGPAYFYLMIEAMVEAGIGVGLPVDVARALAIQTLKGAAKMLDETGEDPSLLRQRVTSPGGTTMAGLQELNDSGFSQAMVRAVARATQRSRELGTLASTPAAVAG